MQESTKVTEFEVVENFRKEFEKNGMYFPKDFNKSKKFIVKKLLELERLELKNELIKIYKTNREKFTIKESDLFLKIGNFLVNDFNNVNIIDIIKIFNEFKIGEVEINYFFIKVIDYLKKTNKYNKDILIFLSYSLLCFVHIDKKSDKKYFEKNERECEYEKRVINNFSTIFPNFNYIKNQLILEGNEKIDIFAEEKITKRPVIIELKINNKNPKRQLMLYGSYFENPILISLTKEECKNKHKDIIYIVYE